MPALRRASGAIAIVHAIKTAFALLVIGQLGLELAREADSGDLIALGARAMQVAPRQAYLAQWAACGYALLGPLLLQWLLAALSGGSRRLTVGVYLRALALSVARYAAVAAAGAGGFWTAAALTVRASPQLELAAGLLPIAGALALVAWLATAHDTAQAGLAAPGARLWHALREGAGAASARLVAVRAALFLAGLGLFALGEAIARVSPWPMLSLAAGQTLALGTTLTGAAWLARAASAMSGPERVS